MYNLKTDKFIKKVIKKFGLRCDYSDFNYINALSLTKFKCFLHGEYWQKPRDHMQGAGCPVCARENHIKKTTKTKDQFVKKARKIHGEIFGYDNFNYINAITKSWITCYEHGDFLQSPSTHLKGSGCPKCGIEKSTAYKKLSLEEIVIRGNKIHNNKYSYDKTVIKHSHEKSIFECPFHGEFLQTPSNHLKGHGCPRCKFSKGEKILAKIFENNEIEFIPQFKIPGNDYKFRYDFYLPQLNILIEFHGSQHFIPSGYMGGEEKFQDTKRRDMFKRELAKLANIPLLEFNYKHLKIKTYEFEKLVLLQLDRILNRTQLKKG